MIKQSLGKYSLVLVFLVTLGLVIAEPERLALDSGEAFSTRAMESAAHLEVGASNVSLAVIDGGTPFPTTASTRFVKTSSSQDTSSDQVSSDASSPETQSEGDDSAGDDTGQTSGNLNDTSSVPGSPGESTSDAQTVDSAATEGDEASSSEGPGYYPLIVLAIGIAIVLGLIIGLKVNAFIALITAAIVVSLMADGAIEGKISRVASSFGSSAGGIGIVIALAAIIGKCMLDNGSADRIVRFFLNLFGEKRSSTALMGSGFVLAVPVFFDTVFYLLVPLARSLHGKTKRDYLKYILAIGAGGAITHTLVPPTPGPLLMAGNLGVDVGMMILIGGLVALPAAFAGLIFAGIAQRIMKTPMRTIAGSDDPEPLDDAKLPPLWLALAPVLLPVLMISTKTITTTIADAEHRARFSQDDILAWYEFRTHVVDNWRANPNSPSGLIMTHPAMSQEAMDLMLSGQIQNAKQRDQLRAVFNTILLDKQFYDEDAFLGIKLDSVAKSKLAGNLQRMKPVDVERMNRSLLESAFDSRFIERHNWDTPKRRAANFCNFLGDANLALLVSTIIALATLVKQRGTSLRELGQVVETALMSGGVIILITAGGGAFGDMLKAANVGPAIEALFGNSEGAGGIGLLLLGFLIAAVLKVAQGSSTVAMIVGSGMMAAIGADVTLSYHPVYLATAIGSGSLMGSWMNDSGFWIFAKMGGLTEAEALKSWTVMLAFLGLVGIAVTLLLASVLPLA